MAIKIDNLEFDNLCTEITGIAGSAFILGQALCASDSEMHADAAFSIGLHLCHVRDKIDRLLNECKEDDEDGKRKS